MGLSLARKFCICFFLACLLTPALSFAQNATQNGFYATMTIPTLPEISGRNRIVARTDSTGGVLQSFTYNPGTVLSVYRMDDFELRAGYSWTQNLIIHRDWRHWANAQAVVNGQPIPTVPTGNFDPVTGEPISPNGDPVDQNGNPIASNGHAANGRIDNATDVPAAYWWEQRDAQGNLIGSGQTPTLAPGEGIDIGWSDDSQFNVTWGPIFDGNKQPSDGGIPSTPVTGIDGPDFESGKPVKPPTTNPIDVPDAPTGTDNAAIVAATNRVGDIIVEYGEDGRRVSNASFRELEKMVQLNREISEGIDRAADAAEDAAQGNGPTGTFGPNPDEEGAEGDTTAATNLVQAVPQLLTALENLKKALVGPGGYAALTWQASLFGAPIYITLEPYSSVILVVRSMLLAFFTYRFIIAVLEETRKGFA
jgi:hypothetical protein